jgi:hypothetical protein
MLKICKYFYLLINFYKTKFLKKYFNIIISIIYYIFNKNIIKSNKKINFK